MGAQVSAATSPAEVEKPNMTHIICNNGADTQNMTSQTDNHTNEINAFMYIVVVLLFYAISMVFFMVKYIRREEEEATLEHYFTEFVKREKFSHGVRDERTCKTTHFIKTFNEKYGESDSAIVENCNGNGEFNPHRKESVV